MVHVSIILDPGLPFFLFFACFLEFCVLAGVIIFSDTVGLGWTLDMLAYFRSVHDTDMEGRFGFRFPIGSWVSYTLLKILNMALAEIGFLSAFSDSKDSVEDVFESLIGVYGSVIDSEAGELITMHVMLGLILDLLNGGAQTKECAQSTRNVLATPLC